MESSPVEVFVNLLLYNKVKNTNNLRNIYENFCLDSI
jgi:hypothetical protein